MKTFREFLHEEEGMGTVELVIILAVLVGIALIFRRYVFGFVQSVMDNVFGGEISGLQESPTAPPASQ